VADHGSGDSWCRYCHGGSPTPSMTGVGVDPVTRAKTANRKIASDTKCKMC